MRVTKAGLCAFWLVLSLLGRGAAEDLEGRRLKAGGDHNYPPYEFLSKGKPTGFDVDILRAVAEVMGLELEIKLGPWHQARRDLEEGRIDVLNGMFESPERDRRVDFTVPYIVVYHSLFARKGSRIRGLEDLRGKEIIVQKDDIMHDYVRAARLSPHIIPVENSVDALRLLAAGHHDAVLIAKLQGVYLIKQFGLTNVRPVSKPLFPRRFCLAVREGDTELRDRLSEGIRILKATGRYDQIYDKWFGTESGHVHYRAVLRWAAAVLVPLVALLTLAVAWSWSLRRRVAQRTAELQEELAARRSTEDALRRSEQRYRLLVDSMNEGVSVVNEDGVFQYVNDRFCAILGHSREELLGRQASEFLDGPSADELRRQIRIRKEGIAEPYELTWLRKDGTPAITAVSPSVLTDIDGQYQGSFGVVTDVTQRRQLEDRVARAEKMESLGRLAGGVAHDLNNVLTGLVGYPDLLLAQTPDDGLWKEAMEVIRDSGQRAAAIVEDLLTLTRRSVPNAAVICLNDLVARCLDTPEHQRLLHDHPQVTVEWHGEPDLLKIMGSRVHLSKTVTNLVANGFEAMGTAGTLTIRTRNVYVDRPIEGYDSVAAGDYVLLEVSDTGVGISPKDRRHIFEPFYTKKVMGRSGTGLGLTVVWGSVSDHKGYVDVESELGKGTTFRLYFPVTREQAEAEQAAADLADLRGQGEKILVVDDFAQQRDVVTHMLEALGYSVHAVVNGEDAVAHLANHAADLVVLDMIMEPGMDGLDTYRQMLQVRPGQRAIIVSGYVETDRVQEAQRLGAGRYVRKPYVMEQIAAAVKEELDRV